MNMKNPSAIAKSKSSKRLVFDRRYGWVFDEWKDPSEEALSGGRGMFCILPLAKALVKMAIQSVNLAAVSLVQALKTPNQFSLQVLKITLDNQFQKWLCSMKAHNLSWLTLNGRSSILAASAIQPHQENNSENG